MFDGEPPAHPPLPKTPVVAKKVVEIVIERAARIENMVMSSSQNKVQSLSAKDLFFSRTFSRVSLIFATCV